MTFRSSPALALLLCVACLARAADYPAFNVRVGGQTFLPRYGFTLETRLVETARELDAMGSDIVKFELSSQTVTNYQLVGTPGLTNLTLLASNEPSVRAVLDMPFRYTLLWAYPLTVSNSVFHPWRDGLSVTESNREYNEVYAFTRYLLRQYNNSGKTFLLGHWEGDWALLGSFSPTATPTSVGIQGMANWLGTRQRAVADARAAEPHTNVFVWNYAEVNLVKKALTGGVTVINNVLTNCTVDLVSYSCYDVLGDPPGALTNALHYIAGKARTTSNFYRDVFIGEFGFPLDFGLRTPQEQADLSADVLREAAGWGCPFVLYWQMYDNEADEGGGNARGFWLIDNGGVRQPVHVEHRAYLGRAHAFKNFYRFWLNRNPDEPALSNFARDYQNFHAPGLLSNILASAEYSNLVSDAEFAAFLVRDLLGGNPARDGDFDAMVTALASGTPRMNVLLAALDGARFELRYDDNDFADMLYGGTLQRATVNPLDADFQQVVAELAAGTNRSALWLQFVGSAEFCDAELLLRHIDAIDDRSIYAKLFFDGDRDADGMADAWERQILAADTNDSLVALGDVASADDFDGDGFANGDEWQAGTSPVAADSDGDGILDAIETGTGCVIDGLMTPTNLAVVENAALIDHHDGSLTLFRTNTSVEWTESIVDWQPGGWGGSLISVTGAPWVTLVPVGFVSGGWWSVAPQFFASNGTYLGEASWFDNWPDVGRLYTNVADIAAASGHTNAALYRLRFRIGPSDNGGSWPGVTLTYISAARDGATMPVVADTDGDGLTDGEEVFAGSKATDAGSTFGLVPAALPSPDGIVLAWPSLSNRLYTLVSSEDVAGLAFPQVVSSNIPATPPLNTYTDAPGVAAYYRIRVH